jgi:hypothetical protein
LGCIDTAERKTFVMILPFSSIGRPWQSQPGTNDTYDTEAVAYRKKNISKAVIMKTKTHSYMNKQLIPCSDLQNL